MSIRGFFVLLVFPLSFQQFDYDVSGWGFLSVYFFSNLISYLNLEFAFFFPFCLAKNWGSFYTKKKPGFDPWVGKIP